MNKSFLRVIIPLFACFVLLASSWLIYRQVTKKESFPDPLGSPPVQITPQGASNYQVIGFLPYWQLANLPYIQTSLLTHLAYFGVAVDDQGQIQTHLDDNTRELGLHRITNPQVQQLFDQTRSQSVANLLVIRAMTTQSITAAVNNQPALISQLVKLQHTHNFDGFNVDFEPTSQTDIELANQVTAFVRELKQTCQCHVSIDVYASAGATPRIWQLSELSQIVDAIVVMGYDFFRTNSPQAGPVAPVYGSPDRWRYDLNSTLNLIYNQVAPEKIILAVPWYGYQWQTLSQTPASTSIAGSGRLATFTRVHQIISSCQSRNLQNCQIGYDSDALSPFLIFQDSSGWQQVWYDDTVSLSHKYQLVQDRELGGIAIWALGYEAPHLELWQQLSHTFFTQ